jgi:hypothetical protein
MRVGDGMYLNCGCDREREWRRSQAIQRIFGMLVEGGPSLNLDDLELDRADVLWIGRRLNVIRHGGVSVGG